MKTMLKKSKAFVLLLGLVILLPNLYAQDDENFYTVSGVVKNARNNRRIQYVTVSAMGTNVGTISNADGEFTLKINKNLDVTEIGFSCLGFINTRVPFLGQDIVNRDFFLQPQTYPLREIEVRSWSNALELMETAIAKFEQNYSQTPSLLTGFYRETAQKGRQYINVSEAVTQIYKYSYRQHVDRDRVQILKGRTLVSPKASDTLSVKLLGGPNLAVFLDIVKNPDLLLDSEFLHLYDFKMDESMMINDRLQFVVRFAPKVLLPVPLYSGTYYIDQRTLSFTRAEFSMDMRDKDKVTRMILVNRPSGLRFSPDEVSYIVSYIQQDDKTYLHYIHNIIRFKCDWRRRLFATNYTVVSELVVTDILKDNPPRIENRDSFSARRSLSSEAMNYYDSDFWGAFNIIEPTESLENAVGRLRREE